MKYANKMLLVPTGRDEPTESKLKELDGQLHKLLSRKDLSSDEKLKLYNQTLSRYLTIHQNSKTQASAEIEKPIENSLKRKISEFFIDEVKKLKKPENPISDDEREYEYDDDTDYEPNEDYETDMNEYESFDDVSEGTTKKLDLDEMKKLNNQVMRKSTSFDLTTINNKEENKFLQKLEKRRNNREDLFEKLQNWVPYKF